MIFLLLSLPKVVVDNDSDTTNVESSERIEDGTSSDVESAHEIELSDSDREKIQYFKGELKNQNKSAIFADSLARTYLRYQQLDSLAKYANLLVELEPSMEIKEKAGNYFYEAFGYAIDESEARRLGGRVRELLGQVVDNDPDNLEAKSKIAMTYVSSSNPMQGITMLREVLEKDPDNKYALYNMGILSIQSGQYDRAIERLEKLLAVDEENIQAMFYLGVSYKETGNSEKARQWLTKAKDLGNDPAVSAAVDTYLQDLK